MTIYGEHYTEGDWIPWYTVYPIFLLHVGIVGYLCFIFTYLPEVTPMQGLRYVILMIVSGFASLLYLIFYWVIFGRDEIKWLIINAGLGFYGVYYEMGFILTSIGRSIHDYPAMAHVAPFSLYILYTFLLRQLVIDITGSRENPLRQKYINVIYTVISLIVYTYFFVQIASA